MYEYWNIPIGTRRKYFKVSHFTNGGNVEYCTHMPKYLRLQYLLDNFEDQKNFEIGFPFLLIERFSFSDWTWPRQVWHITQPYPLILEISAKTLLEKLVETSWSDPLALLINDYLPANQIRWQLRLAVFSSCNSATILSPTTTAQLWYNVQHFAGITVLASRWEWN